MSNSTEKDNNQQAAVETPAKPASTIAELLNRFDGDDIHNAFQAWFGSDDNLDIVLKEIGQVLTKETGKLLAMLERAEQFHFPSFVFSTLLAGLIAGLIAAETQHAQGRMNEQRRENKLALTTFTPTVGEA